MGCPYGNLQRTAMPISFAAFIYEGPLLFGLSFSQNSKLRWFALANHS